MACQLVVHRGLPSTSSIPSPARRLLGKRSDEVEPTLVFSEEELETADRMFMMGRFRKGHFQELTKEHLMCPQNQHQRLTKNLVLEKAVRDLAWMTFKRGSFRPIMTSSWKPRRVSGKR